MNNGYVITTKKKTKQTKKNKKETKQNKKEKKTPKCFFNKN